MATLTDPQGVKRANPSPMALKEAFEQVKNPTVDKASPTLTADSGEFITIYPTRDALIGNGTEDPQVLWFPTWEKLETTWLGFLTEGADKMREEAAKGGEVGPPAFQPHICPQCQTPMTRGSIFNAGGYGGVVRWIPGEASFGFLGLKKAEQARDVWAFWCTSCGKIELYCG